MVIHKCTRGKVECTGGKVGKLCIKNKAQAWQFLLSRLITPNSGSMPCIGTQRIYVPHVRRQAGRLHANQTLQNSKRTHADAEKNTRKLFYAVQHTTLWCTYMRVAAVVEALHRENSGRITNLAPAVS